MGPQPTLHAVQHLVQARLHLLLMFLQKDNPQYCEQHCAAECPAEFKLAMHVSNIFVTPCCSCDAVLCL